MPDSVYALYAASAADCITEVEFYITSAVHLAIVVLVMASIYIFHRFNKN